MGFEAGNQTRLNPAPWHQIGRDMIGGGPRVMADAFTSPRVIAQLNIEHYRSLLRTSLDERTRVTVEKLLADEEAKLASLPESRPFVAGGRAGKTSR
jgi:hypothetical protein